MNENIERWMQERARALARASITRDSAEAFHSVDGEPAIVLEDGTSEWYRHGKLHRDGGLPAVVRANGTREWWSDGRRHRDDELPAVVSFRGDLRWYQHGEPARGGRPWTRWRPLFEGVSWAPDGSPTTPIQRQHILRWLTETATETRPIEIPWADGSLPW